jgi:cytochrome c biogenesis factor
MRTQPTDTSRHHRLAAGALLWLLAGAAVLLTTLVPARTDLLGWTPAFWLVGAPLALLLVLEPRLPRDLLALALRRRPRARQAIWH